MQTDVEKTEASRETLQEAMTFLAAMSSGIEEAVGDTAGSITYLAGAKLGRKFSKNAKKTQNIHEALEELSNILKQANCLWQFETFEPVKKDTTDTPDENEDRVQLVFRDCMIRQSLFLYGHHQKGSLCNMMFGFFSGGLECIMERQSKLEIIHAGENACYKCLSVRRNK